MASHQHRRCDRRRRCAWVDCKRDSRPGRCLLILLLAQEVCVVLGRRAAPPHWPQLCCVVARPRYPSASVASQLAHHSRLPTMIIIHRPLPLATQRTRPRPPRRRSALLPTPSALTSRAQSVRRAGEARDAAPCCGCVHRRYAARGFAPPRAMSALRVRQPPMNPLFSNRQIPSSLAPRAATAAGRRSTRKRSKPKDFNVSDMGGQTY